MKYTVSIYNCITQENLYEFQERRITCEQTKTSTDESKNAILTLRDVPKFHQSFEAMVGRFKKSKFVDDPFERLSSFIYKWLQEFLRQNVHMESISDLYKNCSLSALIEVSILLTKELRQPC